MIANRTLYLMALEYWYNASSLALLQGQGRSSVGFQNALAHYDGKFPTMADGLGKTLQTIPQDVVKAAMQRLAAKSGTLYPHRDDFFQAIASSVGSPTVSKIAAGTAKDLAADVGAVAMFTGKRVIEIAIIGGVIYLLLLNSGPILKRLAKGAT